MHIKQKEKEKKETNAKTKKKRKANKTARVTYVSCSVTCFTKLWSVRPPSVPAVAAGAAVPGMTFVSVKELVLVLVLVLLEKDQVVKV